MAVGMSVGFEASQGSMSSPVGRDGPPTLEELLGLPPVVNEAPEDAVTLDGLCAKCSAQALNSSFAKNSIKFLMEPSCYRRSWDAYTRWLQATMTSMPGTSSIAVGNMAFMSHRVYTMGIRIPVFTLSERFKRKHKVTQLSFLETTSQPSSETRHVQCPAELLGEATGLDPECAAFCVESILRTIGQLAKEGRALDAHFGVGALRVTERVAKFTFSVRSVETTPDAEEARQSLQASIYGGGSIASRGVGATGGATSASKAGGEYLSLIHI